MGNRLLEEETAKRQPRGRPSLGSKRKLSEELISAIESGLRSKSHLDLTNREIASAAGTHAGMIHYYYDGKDGLIDAALDEFSKDVSNTLAQLKQRFEENCEDATNVVLNTWFDLHSEHRGIGSIVWIECFRPESKIWKYYRGRLAKNTFPKMQEVVKVLVKKGYYKKEIDVELVAFSLLSVIHSPIILGTLMTGIGHVVDRLTQAWLDQAARMLDQEYRPAM